MTGAGSGAPKVSAITTAYNSGRYVNRAIDSLLTQTLTDIEVVTVDDGSTDGTGEVLDDYARRDPRVRVIHQANSGGAARPGNRALREARGEYVAILDHDDIALPDRLEKQAAFLDANPNIGVVGGSMIAIDEHDRKQKQYAFPTDPAQVRWWLFRGPTLNHSSTMMRRELMNRVGGYRPSFRVCPDVDLFLRLSDHTELATLPDVVVYYRVHSRNITATRHRQQVLMNHLAIELAHSRMRGRQDVIPEGLYIDATTIVQLALDQDQIARLLPLVEAAKA
jgi:glycosyltransferase involved in cell wall biosynthesis